MWDRHRLLALADAEARQLSTQAVSEVTPSRRDFAQYVSTQRSGLAPVARLESGTPDTLLALAQACDNAEFAALCLAGATADIESIAAAVTAPVFREAFIVVPNQLYQARLHGADAALFPVNEIGFDALQELAAIASSLHMAAIAEVYDRSGLAIALRAPRMIVGLACTDSGGRIDLGATKELADHVPAGRTLLVLPPLDGLDSADDLRGCVDAVTLPQSLLIDSDLLALVERVAGH